MKRRALLAFSGIAATVAPALSFAQSGYPNRAIKLVVGFAPGGATDLVARAVGQKISEALGQPVIIENKAGANSNLAAEAVAKAAPDGYTLFMGTIANAINMALYKAPGYVFLRDFAFITQLMSAPSVLVVHPDLPVKTLRELIDYGRAKPGSLSYASSGTGSSPHLAGEMLCQQSGVSAVHIPYKGAGPALQDVIARQVPMGFKTALSALPHMQAGRLRALAVAANTRLPQLPNVPTMAEAGLADFEVSSWNGLVAPAGTPAPIIARLHAEALKALAAPDVREKFTAQAATVVGSTPDAFRSYAQGETAKWAKVVKGAGLAPE